jgi:hypothetical protein
VLEELLLWLCRGLRFGRAQHLIIRKSPERFAILARMTRLASPTCVSVHVEPVVLLRRQGQQCLVKGALNGSHELLARLLFLRALLLGNQRIQMLLKAAAGPRTAPHSAHRG